MIATFFSKSLPFVGSSAAHIIHATITRIKQTTKTKAIAIFVKAQIIWGNTFVASVFVVQIQFQIIGKFVLSFIQLHSHLATDHINHQKPNNTAKNQPNKYDNTLFFINFGIKK